MHFVRAALTCLFVLNVCGLVHAATRISLHGTMRRADGEPVLNGRYEVNSEIWDVATPRQLLWVSRDTLRVLEGKYRLTIGAHDPIEIDAAVFPISVSLSFCPKDSDDASIAFDDGLGKLTGRTAALDVITNALPCDLISSRLEIIRRADSQSTEGYFHGLRGDSVALRLDGQQLFSTIALSDVSRLRYTFGRRDAGIRQAVAGLLVGAAFGAGLAHATRDPDSKSSAVGRMTTGGAIVGIFAGALGFARGVKQATYKWETASTAELLKAIECGQRDRLTER